MRIKRQVILVFQFLIFVCSLFLVSLSQAQIQDNQDERILNFISTIQVNKDASADITENISVYANQINIQHGIFRMLPTVYTDSYGIKHHTNYDIKQVNLNGSPVDYFNEFSSSEMKIYIGDKSTILQPGIYNYLIQYHVEDAVNFLKDQDELYWNVTGNDWIFPIEKVQATIILPFEASIALYSGYTGQKGEQGKNYKVNLLGVNQITFETLRPLQIGEGLTVAVSWSKGAIIQPTKLQQFYKLLKNNLGGLLGLMLFGFVLAYYLRVWFLYGKDPKKGTIIPLFEPPSGLSPAAMRYMVRRRIDTKVFTVAIVSMATKGFLTIEKLKDLFLIKNTDDTKDLSEDEIEIAKILFGRSEAKKIKIAPENESVISTAKDFSARQIINKYAHYFVNNNKYVKNGIWLSLLVPLALTFSSPLETGLSLFLMAIGICVLIGIWTLRSKVKNTPVINIVTFLIALLFSLIIGMLILGFIQPILKVIFTSALGIILIILLIPLNILFGILLTRTINEEGRKLVDQIEGFKQYLQVAERYRLDQLKTFEGIVNLYEKYLPYAMALDIENEWGTKFNTLMQNIHVPKNSYQSKWFNSPQNQYNMASLPLLVGQAMKDSLNLATVTSSQSASGGSSGSSGGGSGGGGGGGW